MGSVTYVNCDRPGCEVRVEGTMAVPSLGSLPVPPAEWLSINALVGGPLTIEKTAKPWQRHSFRGGDSLSLNGVTFCPECTRQFMAWLAGADLKDVRLKKKEDAK